MNTDKNTALYEKMAAEQDKFRDWLKSQPAAEVLNHAYEYTVREDIVMAMEELDLPQSRAAALLASQSPLADVYKEFSDRETSYMDVVRDSIEQRAEAALGAQRELPLYRHDAAHAREQGDLDLYRASRRANIACKEAIEASISEHYRDNRLDKDAGTLPGQPAGQGCGAPGDRAVRLHPHPLCAGKHRAAENVG